MDLESLVSSELTRVKGMSTATIFALPAHTERYVEKTLGRRVSVSLFVEDAGDDTKRVVAKAFSSRFPHISSRGHADGFRINRAGQISELTPEDRATLY
jgi:hypothetical protein